MSVMTVEVEVVAVVTSHSPPLSTVMCSPVGSNRTSHVPLCGLPKAIGQDTDYTHNRDEKGCV